MKPKYIMTERHAHRALEQYHQATDVGETVRYFRTEAGISQAELGRFAGISQSTVSRIEHGPRGLSTYEYRAFARALGVSEVALMRRRPRARLRAVA